MLVSTSQFSRQSHINVGRLIHAAALVATLAALVWALLGRPADAAEIRVLSAAAMQSVFKQVVGAFERSSGHTPIIEYATMGTIHQSSTPSRFVGVPPASMLRV